MKAEKISQWAEFQINRTIEEVFPLFGAFEERKWDPTWNPILIYPSEEIMALYTTFKCKSYHSEPDLIWRVIKYRNYDILYLVSSEDRYWTIEVKCRKVKLNTKIIVIYTFIGLNERGNHYNQLDICRLFASNLADWAQAIHHYLLLQNNELARS